MEDKDCKDWKVGDMLICISDGGWSPGCVTIGRTYKIIDHYSKNLIVIEGNGGVGYRTDRRSFILYQKWLEDKRNNNIDSILTSKL